MANQNIRKQLQNITEELNESKTQSLLSPVEEQRRSFMSIQKNEAVNENRDAYTQMGAKLKYKEQSRQMARSSSTVSRIN